MGAISTPPRPENKYILPLRAADALPTLGLGAEEVERVSKLAASVVILVTYPDGSGEGLRTGLERNHIDLVVYRLPGLNLTTEDADVRIDDREDMRRAAQSLVIHETLPGALERMDWLANRHFECWFYVYLETSENLTIETERRKQQTSRQVGSRKIASCGRNVAVSTRSRHAETR